MRLFLSSQYFGNYPERLFELIDSNKRHVGIITNSGDLFPEEGTIERLNRDIEYLKTKGFTAERLDLREYFGKSGQLAKKLKEFGLVWVWGGNTFVLRRAMRESGFDEVIQYMLQKDEIVYGGFSAGSCSAGLTLRGIDLVDDKDSIPAGYPSEIIWDGLGVVPFVFVPHFRSDHPESEAMEKW